MGDYVRTRLSASLSHPAGSVEVFISNPGNTQGDTFAYGNPFSFSRVRQVTPQRPRTIGVELSAAF